MNTFLYRLLAPVTRFHGPIPHNPFVFRLYARTVKPKAGPWVAPDEDTDLLVESPGATASNSFVAYMRQHNPGIRISHGCHVPATVRFCTARAIPVLLLHRAKYPYVRSMVSRFPVLSRRLAVRIWSQFMTMNTSSASVLEQSYENVVQDPRQVVRRLNYQFGTTWNEGDGVLPRIRPTLVADPTTDNSIR